VTIRIVTNIVLFINDIYVVFSILFARQLYIIRGLLCLLPVCRGSGTPHVCQRNLLFRAATEIPNGESDQRDDDTAPGTVRSRSAQKDKVKFGLQIQSKRTRRHFQTSENTQYDCNKMRQALSRYKLSHIWTYAARKNALNTCEVKHGVPFLRLARFGFMAQPSCKDLGGILNANAFYSFSTGIFQLAISTLLIASTKGELSLFILLPFSVSAASLVLSVANVLLDFSGILSEIENEKRLAQEILDKVESDRVQDKTRLGTQFEEKKRAIAAE